VNAEDEATTIDHGLCWPENARWRDGRLLYVDVWAGVIWSWTEGFGKEKVADVPGGIVGGIGLLPTGDLLAVACHERRIYRIPASGGKAEIYVDLSGVTPYHLNDMCVDAGGGIYLGNYGWDMLGGGSARPTRLIYISPNREIRWTGDQIWFPNGTVITPDRRLICIESYGELSPEGKSRILEFDIGEDGDLENQKVFHTFDNTVICDGACLDAEGALWTGNPFDHAFVRVKRGKGVTDRIDLGDAQGISPALGGSDGHTLFLLQAEYEDLDEVVEGRCVGGSIRTMRVGVGASSPPSP
jgi:sugar lactone lactonase YvrE